MLHKTYRDPHFRFHVHTNDQRVLDLLESYLDFRDTPQQFTPFFEITFRVTYADRALLPREQKAIYKDFTMQRDIFAAKLHEKTAEVISADVHSMEVVAELYSLEHIIGVMDFVFLQPCRMFLAYRNWVYIHSAHVQTPTHDIIITGASGAGKSSTAYTLGQSPGYCLQSDDEVFIHTDRQHNYCLPFPTRVGFKNAHMQQAMRGHETNYGNKKRYALPTAPENFTDVTPRQSLILVPHYDAAATQLSLEPFDKDALIYDISAFSLPMCHIHFWKKQNQQATLTLLTFIKRAGTFRLRYNDALLQTLPALMTQTTGAGRDPA